MAVKKNKEHSFKRFQADIKSDNLKNVVLLYGQENYLARWSVEQIEMRYVNEAAAMFDSIRLDGNDINLGQLKEACETMPIMSEKRVVTVDNLENIFEPGTDDADEFAEYIKKFPTSTILAILSDSVDKRKKAFKTIQKSGSEYEFDNLESSELIAFIRKKLKLAGCKFNNEIIKCIIDVSGYYDKDSDYTLDNLVNDINKVIAHSGGNITVEDIESVVAGNVERDVFAFSDALASGRKGEALELLSTLLAYRENVFKLLGLICSQFETQLLVCEMKEAGMDFDQMKGILGIHEYRIKKALQMSSRYSSKRLRHILLKAYEVDRNIKSGFSDDRTTLELFVAGC